MMQVEYSEDEQRIMKMIRLGKPSVVIDEDRFMQIEKEMLEEPCELCGTPTKELAGKRLVAMKDKDDKGRPIVRMVCSKCLKSKKRRKK